ncbi:MAG: hypothetical protein EOO40_06150, partial [Deltaproteobacteria bacterium]
MTSQVGPSWVRLHNIEVPFAAPAAGDAVPEATVAAAVALRLRVARSDIGALTVVRRALDAR